MRLFVLAPIGIVAVQAFQSTSAWISHDAVTRSVTFPLKKLFTRGDSHRQPIPYSRPSSSQGRNVRPRFTRSQSVGESLGRTASTNPYVNPLSPGQSLGQQLAQSRSRNSESGGGQSRDESGSQPSQRQPQIHSQSRSQSEDRRPTRSLGQGQTSGLGAPPRVRVASPEAPTRGRVRSLERALSRNQPLSPIPSESLTQSPSLEINRFPSPGAGLGIPDRSIPVHIHTAIDGPASVTGHLGQDPIQNEHIDVPEGTSLNKLWSSPYQAEVRVKTFEGGHGINRAWAAGGRRASIRTNAQSRALAVGSYIGIGGLVSDLKTVHEDPQHGTNMGYIRASTRSYENHVGVDSMYRGAGLTVLRASNSRAGTESRPSSISGSLGTESESEGEVVSNIRQSH